MKDVINFHVGVAYFLFSPRHHFIYDVFHHFLGPVSESFPRIWNHDSERQQCIVEDFDSQRRNKSVSRLLSSLLFGEGKEGTAAAAADDGDAGKATVIVAVVVSAENSDG